jgi:hypothetical protein
LTWAVVCAVFHLELIASEIALVMIFAAAVAMNVVWARGRRR